MRQHKASPPKPVIGYKEDRVLRSFVHYDFLTSWQLTRRLLADSSYTHIQSTNLDLVRSGYLHEMYAPITRPGGRPRHLYFLSQKGINYLAELGLIPWRRARRSAKRATSDIMMPHRLATYDVCIAAEAWARTEPRVSVAKLLTERTINTFRDPAKPDAWVDLVVDGVSAPIAVELDRGEEGREAWQKKLRRLVTWIDTAYTPRYGTDALTIVVLAPGDKRRPRELLTWTEEILDHLSLTGDDGKPVTDGKRVFDPASYGGLMLFGCLDAATVTPATFFTTEHFVAPFTDVQVALAPLP